MNSIHWTGKIAIIMALALPNAVISAADVSPGYGAADFVPTAQRPIDFRADGNGCYPGATPPTEWSQGTLVQIDLPGLYGNPRVAKTAKVWDFADQKSVNILWKSPVAGWGYAHPIVIRDRVILLGHPHFISCYALDSGKELWRRDALPLLCDGLPEEQAKKAQVAIDLASAICMVGGVQGTPFAIVSEVYFGKHLNAESAKGFQERAAKCSRMLRKFRPDIEKIGDPALVQALDQDLALTTAWEQTADAFETLKKMYMNETKPKSKLAEYCQNTFKVPLTTQWSGHCGFADSAPVSDGERIYAVFGQGQIVCYDLEGRLIWAKREGGSNWVLFSRPPLLCGDLLVVRDRNLANVLGLDKRTGATKWTYAWKSLTCANLRHLRIPGHDGAPVDVLILPEHHKIIRLADGKELGEFRSDKSDKKAPAYHILAWEDTILVGGKSTSGPTEPSACYRIAMTGPDSATGTLVYEAEKDVLIHLNWPTATADVFFGMSGGIYDRKTGSKIGKMAGLGQSSVVAGKYLITQELLDGDGNDACFPRSRGDRKVMCGFRVIDISDPKNPRQVNQRRNLLGFKDPPVDYVVRNYLSEFDPYDFAGCYRGTPSYFGTDLAGVVPHGNKLLIQSTTQLYCIGPAVEGTSQDDPQATERIRAVNSAEALTPFLDKPSAMERYEALKRLKILKPVLGEDLKGKLKTMMLQDSYEEIRALSIVTLDTCDPQGQFGWQSFLAAVLTNSKLPEQERSAMTKTLGALDGAKARLALVPNLTDVVLQQKLLTMANDLHLVVPALTEMTLTVMAKPDSRETGILMPEVTRYLNNITVWSDRQGRDALIRGLTVILNHESPLIALRAAECLLANKVADAAITERLLARLPDWANLDGSATSSPLGRVLNICAMMSQGSPTQKVNAAVIAVHTATLGRSGVHPGWLSTSITMLEKMGNTALPALPALQAVAGNTDPKMKDLADMAKKAIETITKDETLKKK